MVLIKNNNKKEGLFDIQVNIFFLNSMQVYWEKIIVYLLKRSKCEVLERILIKERESN